MNPFDLVIAGVLVLSVVYAVYRGAVQTVMNVAALILAAVVPTVASFLYYKKHS